LKLLIISQGGSKLVFNGYKHSISTCRLCGAEREKKTNENGKNPLSSNDHKKIEPNHHI
jgi:hypothetical protein